MTHPLTKSIEEVEREQQEHLEGKVQLYQTPVQRFVKKWGDYQELIKRYEIKNTS